jgi:DNA-binding CsgD family transcriptional regulator
MGLQERHGIREMGSVVDPRPVEAALLADTLDCIAMAMFIVDGMARILHVNAKGRTLLADASVLRCLNGKLSAFDPQAERLFREVIAAARADRAPVDPKGVTLPPLMTCDGTQWLARVLPLTRRVHRQSNIAHAAVAAVLIHKVGLNLADGLATAANVYDLTPAEMRVGAAIVEIGGVPEAATVLGISETTVKTHLQHIFEKTGIKRQADLVKLIAGFASPIV